MLSIVILIRVCTSRPYNFQTLKFWNPNFIPEFLNSKIKPHFLTPQISKPEFYSAEIFKPLNFKTEPEN